MPRKSQNITNQVLPRIGNGYRFLTFIIDQESPNFDNFNFCKILMLTCGKTKKQALEHVGSHLTDVYCYSTATNSFKYEIGKWKK